MISTLLIIVFVLGYVAIALEHPLKFNKAASALITGVTCNPIGQPANIGRQTKQNDNNQII